MAAPHIPNLLNNSRISRPARRKPQENVKEVSPDIIVQQTDDDASGSRLGAVEAGYVKDDYARALAPPTQQAGVRRMPIINRGTYVCTAAIDTLVHSFLASHSIGPVQVISLGAGTDTRFLRLIEHTPQLAARLSYHELDFPQTMARKIAAIRRNPSIMTLLETTLQSDARITISPGGNTLFSPSYSIHAIDLRTLAPDSTSSSVATLIGALQPIPTLLLSEMCFSYLSAAASSSVLSFFAACLPTPVPLSVLLYEPLRPDDAFGRTMSRNLAARGIVLHGLSELPTLESHRARLVQMGFEEARGLEVGQWWGTRVAEEEKERLRALEGLDEEEEWVLLAAHYGFVWGWRGKEFG